MTAAIAAVKQRFKQHGQTTHRGDEDNSLTNNYLMTAAAAAAAAQKESDCSSAARQSLRLARAASG